MKKKMLICWLPCCWRESLLIGIGLILMLFAVRPAMAETPLPAVAVGEKPIAAVVNPVTNKIYIANNGGNTVTVIDGTSNTASTVTVGDNPAALALNLITNQVYVANSGSNTVTIIDGATSETDTVNVGTNPIGVAVNPVTNKVYVTNRSSNTVTVINAGDGNATDSVMVGTNPQALAVNSVTNKIYVANYGSDNVTVIDGSDDTASSPVTVGTEPVSLAINPATDKIYVANNASDTVTVIDGSDNATTPVTVGTAPLAVAVNPVTNKIYVANDASGTVTIIDGSNNTTAPVTVGANPVALAVNPTTGKVYVANYTSANVTVIDSSGSTNTIPAGTNPASIGINPITNQLYVANNGSNDVSVIDASDNTVESVAVGADPVAVAVNPTTNKAYVINRSSRSVTVIDGSNNSTDSVGLGTGPSAVAINPITNKIYVANRGSGTVTVIDGASNDTATVEVGGGPVDLAINHVTNKIYVANRSSNTVTIIDGESNNTETVNVGLDPTAVAVNPQTNQIYVTCYTSSSLYVIDGTTRATRTVGLFGYYPLMLAVDSDNDRIIVVSESDPGFSLISFVDGNSSYSSVGSSGPSNPSAIVVKPIDMEQTRIYVAGLGGSTLWEGTAFANGGGGGGGPTVGTDPIDMAIDPARNKLFVANNGSTYATVIDEVTRATDNINVPADAVAVAVNPITNKIYVVHSADRSVSVITPAATKANPLTTEIAPLPDNRTPSSTPEFTFSTESSYTPAAPPVQQLYYQVDTLTGPWLKADPRQSGSFRGQMPPLRPGLHILYAFAVDAQASTAANTGRGSVTAVGEMTAYQFMVEPPPVPAFSLSKDVDDARPAAGQALQYTISVQNTGTVTATQAVISDTLPSGVEFVGPVTIQGSDGIPGAPPVVASGMTIGVGQWVTVTVPVRAGSALDPGTIITNTATITSAQATASASGYATFTVASAAAPTLTITKAAATTSVVPGQNVVYTISVHNRSTVAATEVSISDPLPDGLTFVGPVAIQGSDGSPGSPPQLATDLTIGGGERVTVTVPVKVNAGLTAGTQITNVATVTSQETTSSQRAEVTVSVAENKAYQIYLPRVSN